MKKRKYSTLSILPVNVYLKHSVIDEHLTQIPSKVGNVKVKEFEADLLDAGDNNIKSDKTISTEFKLMDEHN